MTFLTQRWRIMVAVFYAITCFVLGSIYVTLNQVHLRHQVQLFGSPHMLLQQPSMFLARVDLPADAEATLLLSFADAPPVATPIKADASGRSEHLIALSAPDGTEPGIYPVLVTLESPGSPLQQLKFNVELSAILPHSLPITSTIAQPAAVHVSLIPEAKVLAPHVINQLHLRVTQGETFQPLTTALSARLVYGDATVHGNASLQTDQFGLTTLKITPFAITDWEITATDPLPISLRRTAPLNPSTPLLLPLLPHFTPSQPIIAELRSVHRQHTYYIDLLLQGAWIARLTGNKSLETEKISWQPPSLSPPPHPVLVTLSTCLSAYGCAENASQTAMLWTPHDLDERAALRLLIDTAIQQGNDSPYFQHVLHQLELSPPNAQQRDRLADVTRTRLPTESFQPSLVFDSHPPAQAALDAQRQHFRSQLNWIFGLLLLTGSALLGSWILAISLQRHRAMAKELADEAPTSHLPRFASTVNAALIILIVITFIWASYLLFQKI